MSLPVPAARLHEFYHFAYHAVEAFRIDVGEALRDLDNPAVFYSDAITIETATDKAIEAAGITTETLATEYMQHGRPDGAAAWFMLELRRSQWWKDQL